MDLAVIATVAALAAWNPPATAAALGTPSRSKALGLGLAALVGVALAALAEPVLDLIDVSPPTFRTAAGVVVAVSGAAQVWGRRPEPVADDGVLAGAVVGLGPGRLFASVEAGVDAEWWLAAGTLIAGAALSWSLASRTEADTGTISWLARLVGAVAVLAGVALTVSGIRTV